MNRSTVALIGYRIILNKNMGGKIQWYNIRKNNVIEIYYIYYIKLILNNPREKKKGKVKWR